MKAYAIILICSYLFAAYYLLRRSIHMLQLSSYQAPSYFKTVLNLKWFFPHIVELLFALLFLLFTDNVSAILFSVMFALWAFSHCLIKQKPSCSRIGCKGFSTCAIINIAIILCCQSYSQATLRLAGLLLFASYALSASLPSFANLQLPFRKAVEQQIHT